MSNPDFRIRLGAERPLLRMTILDAANQRVDLSDSTVHMEMRGFEEATASVVGPCEILSDEGIGEVQFDFTNRLPPRPGFYKTVLWVTTGDVEEPYPGTGYLLMEVVSSLG